VCKLIGLLNVRAKAPDTALSATLLLAHQIITSAPLSLAAAKQAIRAAENIPLEQGLDLERELYEPLLKSEDRMEGLMAFKEKRRANFTGR
jgi:methylglutaconyl-CoA hydratase